MYSGIGRFEGSGGVWASHQWLPSPRTPPSTKKILTGFLRFALMPLGSSGAPDPWTPWPDTPLKM